MYILQNAKDMFISINFVTNYVFLPGSFYEKFLKKRKTIGYIEFLYMGTSNNYKFLILNSSFPKFKKYQDGSNLPGPKSIL